MKSLGSGLRSLVCPRQLARTQLNQQSLFPRSWQLWARSINTDALQSENVQNSEAALEALKIPFQGITHARAVPTTPSYFSREPRFNDLYLRIAKLLTQYHHLPTLPSSQAPQQPWLKLDTMRADLGEPIKATHYSRVMRVAKRLNLIEPSVRPKAINVALEAFTRKFDPRLNITTPVKIDQFGRAVGVGKRKASTARAFVVEGTGEVLINGKPLTKVFGRVHDRESAVWALTATQRLDKYNVWALVEGGGTTGQAEALTLAVAKALVAHEPALKTALRRAGCITRDPRAVERKHHGRLKARKAPTWVKR
jgi:small subunit ribosomal protein S9